MRGSKKLVSMLLVLCLTLGALPLAMAEEVVDADLTVPAALVHDYAGQLARGYGGGGGKGAL